MRKAKADFKKKAPADPELKQRLDSIFSKIPTTPVAQSAGGSVRRIYPWWASAAAAAVVISLAGLWLFRLSMPEETIPESQYAVVPVVYEGKQLVALPDGSTVVLNAGSRLSYREDEFGYADRSVTLTGEGYFDVQHNPSKPFKVFTGKVTTTVLGTAFNVKAYAEQDEIEVTVTRGKVEVGDSTGIYNQLLPNEQLAVNKHTRSFKKTSINSEAVIEWKSRFLILDKISMEEAARKIEERFDATITVTNPNLRSCLIVAGFFENESMENIVSMLATITKATYTIDGSNVTITGGQCPNE